MLRRRMILQRSYCWLENWRPMTRCVPPTFVDSGVKPHSGAMLVGDSLILRPGASAPAIQRHYDIGNEFYFLWLDQSHTYSCALWNGDEDLHAAQTNKMDWHLDYCGAKGAVRLLDVGCGWG